MPILAAGIHTHTPRLTVTDPRGLVVRSVGYCRSIEGSEPEERVNRSAYDAMGRLVEQWDPRLWALSGEDAVAPSNLVNRYSLSGKVLGSLSVDAGERINLFGDGDQLLQAWDSRGSERRVEYDELLRPLAIFEQGEGEAARCTERLEYADASTDFAAHNQCGQLIRHDDPAGSLTLDEYALTGGVLEQTQRFLSALDIPDWPQALPARDALLEPLAQAATSSTHFNPLGDVLEQTDAKGNRQQFDYTFDGQLLATHLQLSAQTTAKTLVSDIHYNAYGQVEQETAGNGVISTLAYRAEDGRLLRLQARHGTAAALQDLHYEYDPVGNVLSIEDAALPIRYFANQRVEPKKQYDYDSLYLLIKATGWEAGTASRGPDFNRFDDPGAVANYQQTYRYDAGGNLLELVHVGPQSHSRKLTAARYSNRCLPEQNDRPPTEEEIAAAFDGNGNLLELQLGQAMTWDLRNQLREVRPVERESSDDDLELYLYGGDGMRRRKVRSTQTNTRSLISDVRYLPGLEIRTHEGTGEVLQVICVQAGRSAMQVLHWETAPPSEIANDQYRYNLTDHLGSSSLELDGEAAVISQEAYHPYGSTAWFAGRSEVEAGYKTARYSGKERDATGLYYYGFRYYAPWLQRWINPDPDGDIDGLNLYRFLRNSPMDYRDPDGRDPIELQSYITPNYRRRKGGLHLNTFSDEIQGASSNAHVTVDVSTETYENLEWADKAIHQTVEIMPWGRNNQMIDIVNTNAQNIVRFQGYPRHSVQTMEPVIRVGTGKCGEYGAVTFSLLVQQKLKTPVLSVLATEGIDHQFTVIGDPREISEHEIVVADAWVNFPTAHLLSEGLFKVGQVISSNPPGTIDPRFALDQSWVSSGPVPEESIAGGAAYINNYFNNVNDGSLWKQLSSAEKLGTHYTKNGLQSTQFDRFPAQWLNKQMEYSREISYWRSLYPQTN
ncbi:RHS repeat-associated core domain-containing protein [Pseudomonas gingeri]|uniref:RHS repeat-associated core domain-containing protein n=1 Tax=Pseudomonas gingeri TaxID=117681 RepID=UPI00210D1FFB|nr:RHS repeat-associated core domain-containing protein [Pseudomonas gingeri]